MRFGNGTVALIALTCGVVSAGKPTSLFEMDYHPKDIISRDVCVIGGGSAGTYAATRLRQLGQSVIVVEKQPNLGGHTHTYKDPDTSITVDYGVIAFHNISVVRNHFAHYNISLAPVNFTRPGPSYPVDFASGRVVKSSTNYTAAAAALQAYAVQLAKYPYLVNGYNLPSPIPADLLMPLKDFAAKYNLQPMVQFTQYGGGYADIVEQPTLYKMKLLSSALLRSLSEGFIGTANHDNQALYRAASDEFASASSLFLSSEVCAVKRTKDMSLIAVRTPGGPRLIKARKLVVAMPPEMSNLRVWDLDVSEIDIFSKFTHEGYWTALMTGTGIPDTVSVNGVNVNTTYKLPISSGPIGFSPTRQPGLVNAFFTTPQFLSDAAVKKSLLTALGKLQLPNVTTTPDKVGWAEFRAHVPFFDHVSVDLLKDGFYTRAEALQGHRGTWYTGAAWQIHDSSLIWNFTETLLPRIMAG